MNNLNIAEETEEILEIYKKYPILKGKIRDYNYNKEVGYFAYGQHSYFIDLKDVLNILKKC